MKKQNKSEGIAVIGMSGTFPQAEDLNSFWKNLITGKECIRNFPQQRRDDLENYILYRKNVMNDITLNNHDDIAFYQAAYLDSIAYFDFDFFKLTPNQAKLMDCNQRLLLAEIYHALEDAACLNGRLAGSSTGVFIGFAPDPLYSYSRMISNIVPNTFQAAFAGNLPSLIAGRISHMFDLKGPSILIDTACSSSLVAIHQACNALVSGDCEIAIAGSIKIILEPVADPHKKLGIESASGTPRAFDEESDGTMFGEGVGAVILKPLDAAVRDRDNIHAVIRGSAVNQDGNSISLTSPNLSAQTEVIVKAWERADIDPETITYIEAHGTGTKIGDPVEIKAIEKAFGKFTKKTGFCRIATSKPQIGHMLEAAGMASFIKSVLCLKNGVIPALFNFNKLNPVLNLSNSPVVINTELTRWESENVQRRCGVSGFGFNGTNCHIILEEYRQMHREHSGAEHLFFTLSAFSMTALKAQLKKFIGFLKENPGISEQDICFTMNTGRDHFNYRIAVVLMRHESLSHKLMYLIENTDKDLHEYNIYFNHQVPGASGEDEFLTAGADAAIKEYNNSHPKDVQILMRLAALYVKGAVPDFNLLYTSDFCRRISLPLYPYEKKKCWLELPDKLMDKCLVQDSSIYHKIVWRLSPLPEQNINDTTDTTIMVIKDDLGKSDEIISVLRGKKIHVIEVQMGSGFLMLEQDRFAIDGSQESFKQLLTHLNRVPIKYILHFSSLAGLGELDTVEEVYTLFETGLFSVLNLAKATMECRKAGCPRLIVIADYMHSVCGDEKYIKDYNAPLAGFIRILGKEFPGIKCRLIDIDDVILPDNLVQEILSTTDEYLSAYRKNMRYIEYFIDVNEENTEHEAVTIDKEGVYMITGGTGGIGLEIARYLLGIEKINIALVGRTALPASHLWDSLLINSDNKNITDKISAIRALEKPGGNIIYYSADVSEEKSMQLVVDELKQKFGRIKGIVHCAGIPGENFITNITEKSFLKNFSSKIAGTLILDKLACDADTDFFILCSSIASIFGSVGQAEYAAANVFLDAFAAKKRRKKMKALSINWCAWKETGMALNTGLTHDLAFKLLPTRQAMAAFDTVINRYLSQVVIGEINYSGSKSHLLLREAQKLSGEIITDIKKSSNRKNINMKNPSEKMAGKSDVLLKGNASGEYNEIEKDIGRIWAEIFGMNSINVTDNFFELGGDSIIAVNIVDQLNEWYNIDIELMEILNHLSIAELAVFIAEKCSAVKMEQRA